MLSVAEPSEVGNPAALEVALEGADTQRQFLLDQWELARLVDHLEDQVASEAVSEVVSMVEEAVEASEAASKIVEATVVVVEVVLATKEAEVSHPEEVTEVIVVPVPLHQMRQQVPEVEEVVVLEVTEVAADIVEAGMAVLDPLIAMEVQHHLVGMIRVEAVAHMMTETEVIAAAEVTTTATQLVAVVATWSR